MIQLRKWITSEEVGKNKLRLELQEFPPKKGKADALVELTLNTYDGLEVAKLFNNNYECLFNHVQVRNKIYFFTIEQGMEKDIVRLRKIILPAKDKQA